MKLCGPEPDLFGAVVVHRFDMGMDKCRCGGIEVKRREPGNSYNRQGWTKGRKRGPRRPDDEESDDVDREGDE